MTNRAGRFCNRVERGGVFGVTHTAAFRGRCVQAIVVNSCLKGCGSDNGGLSWTLNNEQRCQWQYQSIFGSDRLRVSRSCPRLRNDGDQPYQYSEGGSPLELS